MAKILPIVISIVLGLLVAFFGVTVLMRAYLALSRWDSISGAYAACAVLWVPLGAAMVVGGLSMLASLGRRRFPLFLGGGAAVLAGAVLAVGVLTYVIPCAGPS